ncbi:MAG: Polyketide synthase PksL [Verrucomicrobia subdivision 3 bacterium]|nr:Polyketide synthase PksL [Limisphaerales bacterium]
MHENVSDFSEQRYAATFTGREFFLADHVIRGSKILPGVAYLEMARAAASLAARRPVAALRQVVWPRPIQVGSEPLRLGIHLQADEEGGAAFQVTTAPEGAAGERVVHAQGKVLFAGAAPPPPPEALDLEALRSRCERRADPRSLAQRLAAAGLGAAGESFRAMSGLVHGDAEALAELTIPACVEADYGAYVLHPSMMDVAFEAVQFLFMVRSGERGVRLPFSLGRVQIHGALPKRAFAHVRRSAAAAADGSVRFFDIDLADERGRVMVAFREYAARRAPAPPGERQPVLFAAPAWRPEALEGGGAAAAAEPRSALLALPRAGAALGRALAEAWPEAQIESLDASEAAFPSQAWRVMQWVRERMAAPDAGASALLLLLEEGVPASVRSGFAGLLRTARLEDRRLLGKVVSASEDGPGSARALAERLRLEAAASDSAVEIRYRPGGRREVRRFGEVPAAAPAEGSAVRAGDVVWITGGLGGLGRIFARYFGCERQARLVLSGRSALGAGRETFLGELKEAGAEVLYLRGDAANRGETRRMVETVLQAYGRLDGVVHAAGVAEDAYLRRKTAEQAGRVLAPKVAGALNLDEATADLPLNFLALFSSIAGAAGNPGQADYAAANAFLDGFARERNRRVRQGARSGRTLAIDWPLWREGGMGVSRQNEALLEQTTGMRPLPREAGLSAFETALSRDEDQLLVAGGDLAKIRTRLVGAPPPARPRESAAAPGSALQERLWRELARMVADQHGLDVAEVGLDAELSRFGFDSITLTEFANHLNRRFQLELMPTLFFEHSTLRSLGRHLAQQHPRAFSELPPPAPAAAAPAGGPPAPRPAEPRREGRLAGPAGNEPIAVIGLSGRFPGSRDLETFWRHLEANRDLICEVPPDRWDWRAYYGDPLEEFGKTKVKSGGFMEEVDRFDPLFFDISPKEAQEMDPQQRLFLETAWAVIEDAGYAASELSGSRTGVFAGVTNRDYQDLLEEAARRGGQPEAQQLFLFAIPNRVSFLLNLHGPSEPVDTACSSSLVAVHRAVESLRRGECDLALAGGVNVMASPRITLGASRAGMLSEDGRCKTFDRRADGYGRGEGVAAVLLKPLERARREGDRIYGLICGSGENHGGRAASPTAPNPAAQQRLLVDVYTRAGIPPRTLGYIEAHGTGTELGDPIEIDALKAAFRELNGREGRPAAGAHCGLGSVKANIGHLEAGAGISGLIKVLLMLRHRRIPGNPHLREPNPYLRLEDSPFYLVRETRDWVAREDPEGRPAPRRAGVSSFGIGGANAHVILEEFVEPAAPPPSGPAPPALIVLSARNRERLAQAARRLLDFVGRESALRLPDLAYTLQVGREAMEERLAFLAGSASELAARLRRFLEGGEEAGLRCGRVRRAAREKAGEPRHLQVSERLAREDPGSILAAWVQGGLVDWKRLYGRALPRRMSLPSYPFARQRHWVLDSPETAPATGGPPAAARPPFAAVYDGEEFFLADHVLKGKRVLPGVMYLELVRRALAEARAPEPCGLRLQHVVWARPIMVPAQGLSVGVDLEMRAGGARFEVFTAAAPEGRRTHGRGHASWGTEVERPQLALEPLRAACPRALPGERCYAALAALGFQYGGRQRGIETLWVGERQLVARLRLPAELRDSRAAFVLHPCLMDSALQAGIGFVLDAREGAPADLAPALPFALDQLELFAPCPEAGWAWLRPPKESRAGGLERLDIDLCDDDGRLCVRLLGLSSRAVAAAPAAPGAAQGFEARAADYLRKLLSEALKLPPGQIQADEPLERYGIDSVKVMQLTNQLEKVFGPLSKTLFFEYQTIQGLSGYFVEHFAEELREAMGGEPPPPAPPAAAPTPAPAPPAPPPEARVAARAPAAPPPEARPRDIAVIGLAGRYPQSPDLRAFWENLREGRDCITEVPPDRWDWREYYSEDPEGPRQHLSKWGGFIADVDKFDPLFFNISPREAEFMDPQERLFIETAWSALEDAGYGREGLQLPAAPYLPGQIGVYAGIMYGEYQLLGAESSAQGRPLALSGSYAGAANRVSYLLDLHGPSLSVDTMCSSSLTCLHLACQDLILGRTELGVAGGVNLTIHPNKYRILSGGRLLSTRGHCESFGVGGEGYIPGEGVGVAVLKPLAAALRDGDQIYGVIKGSAVNHGGKTNGYSVPNPLAQESVIARALSEAGVDPRRISYLEAHGTGTKLGDPVEIAGLTRAFRRRAAERQFCWLGSAKSNIGHCEAAAGIAGLTKVLLQLRHGKIAPSLHSRVLNPHIDFASTPFVVNQELREWTRPLIEGQTVPRTAGLSSFGAGGSNAHMIIQEYTPPPPTRPPSGGGGPAAVAVVLSARDQGRLLEYGRRLIAFLTDNPRVDMEALAYTFQLGRQALETRLGAVVRTAPELRQTLSSFVAGREVEGAFFQGEAGGNRTTQALFAEEEALQGAVSQWLAQRKLHRLVELWVRGVAIDWRRLYAAAGPPRRISLPTYPFARERHWARPAPPRSGAAAGRPLHPLLHENTSDLREQRYTSTFNGSEFFLAGHVVRGQRILPAVAYLEMARAAVKDAAARGADSPAAVQLRNVVWERPLAVGAAPETLSIRLREEGGEGLRFEIRAAGALLSQGAARAEAPAEAPPLDIGRLRERMAERTITGEECYRTFEAMGICYGGAQRGLRELFVGRRQVLARLQLPDAPGGEPEAFVLHPGLMDAALQAGVGLLAPGGEEGAARPALPFALDELSIRGACPPAMWAWVRPSGGEEASPGAGARAFRLDIDLCDEQGRVAAALRGLALRPLALDRQGPGKEARGLLLGEPVWQRQDAGAGEPLPPPSRRIVLFCDVGGAQGPFAWAEGRCVYLSSRGATLAERYQELAEQVFQWLRDFLRAKRGGERVLLQLVVPGLGGQACARGLGGLLKTVCQEDPAIQGQLIEVAKERISQRQFEALLADGRWPQDAQIRYAEGVRQVLRWREMKAPEGAAPEPWREGGVYLITGGAGGLGLAFAQEIAAKTREVTLVLAGRSAPSAAAPLPRLSRPGAAVEYVQMDAASRPDVERALGGVREKFGGLNGILHGAGIIRDALVWQKERADFAAVLAPKVAGAANLDWATREMPLDCFILFSSLAAVSGNPGQSDYAAANGFMDAFAAHRNALVRAGKRSGRTVSINWPLWEEGGMRVEAERVRLMAERTGMRPLRSPSGFEALRRALRGDQSQVLVMEGDPERLRRLLGRASESAPPRAKAPSPPPPAPEGLREAALGYFTELLSSALGVPASRVRLDESLERYGVDSIVVMRLTEKLESIFGPLSKTLFFEHETLAALAEYFLKSHTEKLAALVGAAKGPREGAGGKDAGRAPASSPPPPPRRRTQPEAGAANRAAAPRAPGIAIIGLSGRYPLAEDLEAFWRNLRAGRDCISQVPSDRWEHDQFYDEDKTKPGSAYGKWGGFLDDVDKFDPLFFNISPREAELMDPNERLFLQTVWGLIEGAGHTRDTLRRRYGARVGVFVGAMYQQYRSYARNVAEESMMSLSSYSSIANRVSFFFDFQGPSVAIDTMCSSSLIAVQMACESLLRGDCRLAVAGGTNLSLHPSKYIGLSMGRLIGSGKASRSFGEGDGYLPAEGVGAVLLKPLAQAIKDDDAILAVIRSGATNHTGRTHGFRVPDTNSQVRLIRRNLQKSGVDPRTISYVESAANGSSLGDAIELAALKKAFEAYTSEKQFCAIGSVKSNIGHAEAASGISQLTKVVLQLQHRELVPSILKGSLNPNLNFADSPFYLQRELQAWKPPALALDGAKGEAPRRATVSSFGAGGSNAHLIIEEYVPPPRPPAPPAGGEEAQLILLSAKNPARLAAALKRLNAMLKANPEVSLPALAYTLQRGREAMPCRLAAVARGRDELMGKLAAAAENGRAAPAEGVYLGQREHLASGLERVLSGELGEQVIESLWKRRELEKLALCWVQGRDLPWAKWREGEGLKTIALPTYPFEKRRCWLNGPPDPPRPARKGAPRPAPLRRQEDAPARKGPPDPLAEIARFLAETAGIDAAEVRPEARLGDYGIDSLLGMRLLNRLQEVFGAALDPALAAAPRRVGELAAAAAGSPPEAAPPEAAPPEAAPPEGHPPPFIERVELRLPPAAAASPEGAQRLLRRLIGRGVGVWQEEGSVFCEFFKGTQSPSSLRRALPDPAALLPALEKGRRYYPASVAQQMALHDSEVNGRAAFNLLQGFWIEMPLRLDLLNQAFQDMTDRYSIFRTGAARRGAHWVQIVEAAVAAECQTTRWPEALTQQAFAERLQGWQEELGRALFDVARPPLAQVHLVHNARDRGAVLFHSHHFCCDGFTLFLFQQELCRRYEARVKGERFAPPPLRAQYAHFALSQFSSECSALARLWADKLPRPPRRKARPAAPERPAPAPAPKAKLVHCEVSAAELAELMRFNRTQHTTLTQLFTCALAVVLLRLTGRNHAIEMVCNLRDRAEFELAMGDYSSSLPICLQIEKSASLRSVLAQYARLLSDLQRCKRSHLLELRRLCGGRGPEVMAADFFGRIAVDSNDRDTLLPVTDFAQRMIPLSAEKREPVNDLVLFLVKTNQQLSATFMHDPRRLSEESARLLAAAVSSTVKQLLDNADLSVREVALPEGLGARFEREAIAKG